MSNLDIDPRYVNGYVGAITSPSTLGIAMFIGTRTEGLGFPDAIIPLALTLSRSVKTYEQGVLQFINAKEKKRLNRKYKAQGKKDIIMETGANRLFGTKDIKNFIMPDLADKTVEWIKHFARKGAYDKMPMAPQILPFQIVSIGEIAIVAIPFEPTTVAAKRLISSLEKSLLNETIKDVILCPYSNAYNGYITTTEEYEMQEYEGGHTVFGQWTLQATQQICTKLVDQFHKDRSERNDISEKIEFLEGSAIMTLEY